jgi:hypothetical protein
MPIREELKALLAKENITMTELTQKLSVQKNKDYSLQSISQKLIRGTLSFNEVELIADILNYDIKFEKRN